MSEDEPLQLRDFVSETIKQIVDGVATAQKYVADKNAVVNPSVKVHAPSQTVMLDADTDHPVQSISFDVAVTASKGTKTQGGVAVFIGVLGLGSKGQSDRRNESVNRIQFSVPISLPAGQHKGMPFRHTGSGLTAKDRPDQR